MSEAWSPSLYLRFADERLRPGFDLLARVGDLPDGDIWDLGCGTGAHARAMAARWPDHAVFGLDSSPEMLVEAERGGGRVGWRPGDVTTWRPERPAALVFSNAMLQWVDAHQSLFPQLFAALAPGGTLAVQMPRNFSAPSHALMRETALDGPWRERLQPLLRTEPVQPPEAYHDLLRAEAASLDLWETEYLHALPVTGARSPVIDWVRATALRPLLAALAPSETEPFLAAYDRRLASAYPVRAGDIVLLPFRRLFMVVRRRA